MVPNDAEHKSLCNWLKNQRNQMRDYETKPQSVDNNYAKYPEYQLKTTWIPYDHLDTL
jgi:hypothetical protein